MVRVDRGQCDVVTAGGVVRADTAFVVPPDPMRVICTSDRAAVDPAGGDPRFVREYLPRRTAFVRSTSSQRSEGQILAANVDHAIIAVSLAVEIDLGRIERFLALAWSRRAKGIHRLGCRQPYSRNTEGCHRSRWHPSVLYGCSVRRKGITAGGGVPPPRAGTPDALPRGSGRMAAMAAPPGSSRVSGARRTAR